MTSLFEVSRDGLQLSLGWFTALPILILLGLFAGVIVFYRRSQGKGGWLPDLTARLNALLERSSYPQIPQWLVGIGVLFGAIWLTLLTVVLVGFVWVPLSLAFKPPADSAGDYRLYLITFAAITAALGALVALPFTLLRIFFTSRQTRTAENRLDNDRLNDAMKDLAARYTETVLARSIAYTDSNGRHCALLETADTTPQIPAKAKDVTITEWERLARDVPDIVTRNAAIDRLLGLAEELPAEAPRIAATLSIYVRETTVEDPPARCPDGASVRDWVKTLAVKRPDRQRAAQVLGRLKDLPSVVQEALKLDLRGANLQRFDLARLNFAGVDLSGAQMAGADLSGAQMKRVDLSGAEMEGADLSGAQMEGVDLRGAQMERAYLSGAQIAGADLRGTQMEGVDLSGAEMEGADLSGAEMEGANLSGAQMEGADLSEAKIGGGNLSGARMKRVNLRGAEMKRADLCWAEMEGADLSRAEMGDSDLCWAEMKEANLSGAKMKRVNLRGAEMNGVNLQEAEMKEANLSGVKFKGTDFCRAEMKGADLRWATFDASTSLSPATLRGAGLREVDFMVLNLDEGGKAGLAELLRGTFGDGSVTLPIDPPGNWHAHEKLRLSEFFEHWRAHRERIGYSLLD
ncbi:MAG: pentapeptide repeat-containing protein [Pseudomonadota bacterium]